MTFRPESICFGILLTYSGETRSFDLLLRVPPIPGANAAKGEIEIVSGLGSKRYLATQLGKARLVSLLPRVPLGECSASGDLLSLAFHLSRELESFGPGLNVFYCEERAERLIAPNEPLEWGTTYRVLADRQIDPPVPLSGVLEWQGRGKLGEMWLYEASLPSVVREARAEIRTSVSEFFGRPVRGARPRAYLVWPSPHHYDVDGTHVYSWPPDPLLVRRTTTDEVTVTAAGSQIHGVSVRVLSEEWVSVEGLVHSRGEILLSIDGNEQALLRVEACELFRPPGLLVRCAAHEWDPLGAPPIGEPDLTACELAVDCGNALVAEDLSLENVGWSCEGVSLTSPAGRKKHLEAGGFGSIGWAISPSEPPVEIEESQRSDSRTPAGLGIWIEGLARTEFGQLGAMRIREFLLNPTTENLQRLGPIAVSSLMPYVRAAVSRRG